MSGAKPEERTLAVAAEFDQAAPTWEVGRLAHWYQAQGHMVLDAVGRLDSGLVVDIGCGTGWLLRQLLRDRPRLRGLGIDLSGRMVETAEAKARAEGVPNVAFRQGDWEGMPIEPLLHELGQARLVTCVSSFHYFRDPLKSLRKVRRITAPGGRLMLVDRDKGGAPLTAALDLLHRRVIRDHCRFYRASEVERLLREAGFGHVRIEQRVRRLFWHGKAVSSLAFLSGTAPGRQERAKRSGASAVSNETKVSWNEAR